MGAIFFLIFPPSSPPSCDPSPQVPWWSPSSASGSVRSTTNRRWSSLLTTCRSLPQSLSSPGPLSADIGGQDTASRRQRQNSLASIQPATYTEHLMTVDYVDITDTWIIFAVLLNFSPMAIRYILAAMSDQFPSVHTNGRLLCLLNASSISTKVTS